MGRPKKVRALGETGGTGGLTWTWLVPFLVAVLKPVVKAITPMIREEIEKAVRAWYPKALASPNPWDDFLVSFLADILNISLV